VVGWALDDHLRAELVVLALLRAIAARHPPTQSDPSHRPRDPIYLRGLSGGARALRSVGQHERRR
jgi:hypothetical protein